MNKIMFLMAYAFIMIGIVSCANEIDYGNCKSIQDAIIRETQELAITHPDNHDELAQLYASRGESYLLDAQYEKAVEDFQNANAHVRCSHNADDNMVIAFRTALGEVVSYDNLGMHEETQQSLLQLQTIVSHVGCDDCTEHHSRQEMILSSNALHFQNEAKAKTIENFCKELLTCKDSQDYGDILGPDQPPESDWCEEVIFGVAGSMQVIAAMAPNWGVKSALIGTLEALKQRGIRCCRAGGFWKACVAPITRKWREWKTNKEKYLLPNAQNLPLYIN